MKLLFLVMVLTLTFHSTALFADDSKFVQVNVETLPSNFLKEEFGLPKAYTQNVIQMSFSPDGKFLAFATTDRSIWMLNLTSKETKKISLAPTTNLEIGMEVGLEGIHFAWLNNEEIGFIQKTIIDSRQVHTGIKASWQNKQEIDADKLKKIIDDLVKSQPYFINTNFIGQGGTLQPYIYKPTDPEKTFYDTQGSWELLAMSVHPNKPLVLQPLKSYGQFQILNFITHEVQGHFLIPASANCTASAMSSNGMAAIAEGGWSSCSSSYSNPCRLPKIYLIDISQLVK